jgi:MFS family permease
MARTLLTKTVLLLGLISLFTDLASEMLYPVLPLYLESIGFGVFGIGLLEGVAEATAGLSKGFFGQWSDRIGRRRPFVQWGYGISAVAKPLMAAFPHPLWVLFARTVERLGKGIRTGGRDALLSAEARPDTRARVFGFHRAMDTTGAALGPLLALLFLWYYPGQYRWLFVLAIVPGALAILATLWLREAPATPEVRPRPGFLEFLRYVRTASPAYRRLLYGLIAFALINSSDLFLLLLLKELGLSDTAVIGWYVYYNLIYALAAYPLGSLADRLGVRPTFLFGLACFVLVYGLLPWATDWYWFAGLFLLYGLFAAATEGIAKAWIASTSSNTEMGTAIGTYTALGSLASLLASSLAGAIWYAFGANALFAATALAAAGVWIYFATAIHSPGHPPR